MTGDSEIIQRILSGRKDEYAVLVNRYKDGIHKYIYRLAGGAADVDALAADTFFRAYKNLIDKTYNPDKGMSFKNWLYMSARSVVWNHNKKKNPDTKGGTEVENCPDADSEKHLHLKLCVEKQMRKLKPNERELAVLYFIEEMDIQDIAAILGRNRKTVSGHIEKLTQKLQSLLGDCA